MVSRGTQCKQPAGCLHSLAPERPEETRIDLPRGIFDITLWAVQLSTVEEKGKLLEATAFGKVACVRRCDYEFADGLRTYRLAKNFLQE